MKFSIYDSLGGVSSAACFVHCLIVSFAPTLMANVDWLSANNEVFEWSFFFFAMLFAIFSAFIGIRKHRNTMVISGFTIGILALGLGRASEALSLFEGGHTLSIIGGLTLFFSHIQSMRCCEPKA